METAFNITIGIAVSVVIFAATYIVYRGVTDYEQKQTSVTEKVTEDTKKQDSLLLVIKKLEDSIDSYKVKRIKEIEIRYEKTVDSIKFLNPTEQVELLTRNLSKINGI